jgi:hypothetical protein
MEASGAVGLANLNADPSPLPLCDSGRDEARRVHEDMDVRALAAVVIADPDTSERLAARGEDLPMQFRIVPDCRV